MKNDEIQMPKVSSLVLWAFFGILISTFVIAPDP